MLIVLMIKCEAYEAKNTFLGKQILLVDLTVP